MTGLFIFVWLFAIFTQSLFNIYDNGNSYYFEHQIISGKKTLADENT